MSEGIPDEESIYAQEGTTAHALAELEASLAFEKVTRGQYLQRYAAWSKTHSLSSEQLTDMKRFVAQYVELLKDLMEEFPNSILLLEQQVHTGIEGCWGTSDAIIVSPQHVHVIDFKYGQGVAVSAERNPQIMLYGVGGLEEYGDLLGEVEIVKMTIYQPRLGRQSTYSLLPASLLAWRDEIRPIAERALGQDAEFGPSPEACRWCPVAATCRARLEYETKHDFATQPEHLTPEEVGEILEQIPSIRAWCDAVEKWALNRVYSEGKPVPGWKVVLGNGRRSIQDSAAAIQTLIDAGYTAEQVANFSTKPIGELEKLVGKKELPLLLGDLLVKKEGNPVLVREEDNRPSVTPATEAAKDFVKEEE